jgi:hypothetical protein
MRSWLSRNRCATRDADNSGLVISTIWLVTLRLLLRSRPKRVALPELPTFHGGGELVDIADREALYQAMEGR